MKPKRILIVTDLEVWPPLEGNRAKVWALMNTLRGLGHEVAFLGLGLMEEAVEALAARWKEGIHNIPRVRIRDGKTGFGGIKRMILNEFYDRGIGSPALDHWICPYMERGLAKFSAAHSFDVVIAEYVFFSKALLYFGPEVLKVVDTHDVWTGRREKLKTRNVTRFWRYLVDVEEEIKGLERADVVMSIQENESIYFRKILGDSRPVVTVGHTVAPKPLPLPVNSDLLFMASRFGANVEGLLHFLKACLPGIREVVPEARVLVAGSICEVLPPDLPGVKRIGLVEDVESAYRMAGVVINPVRTGTGLKTKSIEALAFYRALVTTPSGAEGIESGRGDAFRVAEDDAAFSAAVVELLTNRAKLESLATGGLDFVKDWNVRQVRALQSILSIRDLSA
jgi:hypothetical protein